MALRSDAPKHWVYLLQSVDHPDEHYIGLTANVRARLADHNSGKSPHTAKFRPWKVIYASWFDDPTKAAAFEQYLKSGSGRAFANKHFR